MGVGVGAHMARTGRPHKPTALKKLAGTLRKDRTNRQEWIPPAGAPTMPEGLDAVARAEWRKAVELLLPAGLLTLADGRILESYCRAVSRARAAAAVVETEGLTVETQQGCQAHPATGIEHRAWEAANRYGERLGLDPSSRSKLRVPEKPKADPDEDFLSRGRPPLTVVRGGGAGE
jgi:P27 family predicted phage terminase small subunit